MEAVPASWKAAKSGGILRLLSGALPVERGDLLATSDRHPGITAGNLHGMIKTPKQDGKQIAFGYLKCLTTRTREVETMCRKVVGEAAKS